MKRQLMHEGQIEAGRAADVVVDRIGVLIHLVGELEQRERHVGSDGHVELRIAERRNHECLVVRAAGDFLAARAQAQVQAADGQRSVVRVSYAELDREVLLQQVAAAHFDRHHGHGGSIEFGRHGRTGPHG